ncbi:GNAT family N-acetyltransferase [Colwellia sp. 1_MG-2023]|uniref:GNAT family N-acetyltransferase n=1 Tax=Colwellia sp. 1_MG-2023 TaxID=3062649 RepID=UPI0026E1E175|nr:GNAT family N-acetyltransferase [Colwellia sp. 1_MG-2023]MDO6444985.1 GNAT family N-acetyltransferase [Colwellia sp. 1_MG-2023]
MDVNQQIEFLKFDSELFKLPIASHQITKETNYDLISNEIRNSKIELLYLFSEKQQDIKEIESNIELSVTYADEKVIFEKCLEGRTKVTSSDKISLNQWNKSDLTKLESLAIASGEYSRFKLDQNLSNDENEKLYYKWLHKSLSFELADNIYIYDKEKIAGLLTVKFDVDKAVVGLLSVDEVYRGQGIAGKLLTALENDCISRGIKIISIPTQRINQNACKFYLKQGYSEIHSSHIYHCWNR